MFFPFLTSFARSLRHEVHSGYFLQTKNSSIIVSHCHLENAAISGIESIRFRIIFIIFLILASSLVSIPTAFVSVNAVFSQVQPSLSNVLRNSIAFFLYASKSFLISLRNFATRFISLLSSFLSESPDMFKEHTFKFNRF